MRILFLTHAFNSLAQRLYVELTTAGHEVSIEFDINDRVTEEAVELYRPEVIVAPFLKRAIPESVWSRLPCLIVHPGIVGDRGPSALDWAITNDESSWGVTVLQATGEMDAGPVWASVGFPMRRATKSSLYRNEVTEAAVLGVREALARLSCPGERPWEVSEFATVTGCARPPMRQADRAIDWSRDDTDAVLRRIRAADGFPGVRDDLGGIPCHLFGGQREDTLNADGHAAPGTLIAKRLGAVCIATRDGAVWVTHLKSIAADRVSFKLPAVDVLGAVAADLPEVPLDAGASKAGTWRDIVYEEADGVGYLHFPFYNGAMGVDACERLRAAYVAARSRPTRVIALMGGPDFWSNGIDLNRIEADPQPAEESWRNINAMNDLVREIICTDSHLTIAAIAGNAGAGGVFLALAADRVYARTGVVLNPHYKGMGNLYGSEYWTYLLPRRVGAAGVASLVESRLPIGAPQAAGMGLVDQHFGASRDAFRDEIVARARALAADPQWTRIVAEKGARRATDESGKPLQAYRDEELAHMKLNFFGFDSSYHVARYNFVAKVPRSRTPVHLALHRRRVARPAAGARGPIEPPPVPPRSREDTSTAAAPVR